MEQGKRDQVNLIWALGGLYLVYTGGEMLYRIAAGEAELLAVSGLGGLTFLVVGGLMLCREWRAFQAQKRHRTEEPETAEEPLEKDEGGEEP